MTGVHSQGSARPLVRVSQVLPLVFPIHPRTRKSLEKHGLLEGLQKAPGLHLGEPIGYVDFHEPGFQLPAGGHRLRRHPGRVDLSRHPLPDAEAQHRAPYHHHPGDQPVVRRGGPRSESEWRSLQAKGEGVSKTRAVGRPDSGAG